MVYVILGVLGWYWWLYGGQNRTVLSVSHLGARAVMLLAGLVAATAYPMTLYLRHVHDAAPFWDALTTVLSLAAQYLLTKKWIENCYVWMSADVIYVGLYAYKHLYLTGALYLLFLGLCMLGLREWRRPLEDSRMPVEVWHG